MKGHNTANNKATRGHTLSFKANQSSKRFYLSKSFLKFAPFEKFSFIFGAKVVREYFFFHSKHYSFVHFRKTLMLGPLGIARGQKMLMSKICFKLHRKPSYCNSTKNYRE